MTVPPPQVPVQLAAPRKADPAAAPTWFAWALAALAALPSLLVRFPIGPDLAMHAYCISGLANFSNHEMFPKGLLELNLGHPNQLFSLVVAALAQVMPLSLALRLVVALNAAVFVLGAARLLRHRRRDLYVLGIVVPFALGYAYYVGLQAYELGTGLMLAAVVDLERFCRKPNAKSAFAVIAWTAVLYLAHQQVQVMYSGIALLFAMASSSSLRAFALRSIPFVVGLAATGLQLWLQNSQMIATAIIPASPLFMPLDYRLWFLVTQLFGFHVHLTTFALDALVGLGLVLMAIGRLRGRPFRWWPGRRALLWRFRYVCVFLVAVLLFLFGPNSLNTANYVAERFAPWAALFAIVCLAPSVGALPKLGRAYLVVLPLGHLLVMTPALIEHDRSVERLEPLVGFIQPQSAVAMLDSDLADPNGRFTGFSGDAWVAAQIGGRPLHQFCYTSISVVKLQARVAWKDAMQRVFAPKTLGFHPLLDLTVFRYVLLHSRSLAKSQLFARLLAPETRFVASTGEWTLLESKLPVRSITTPMGKLGYCGDNLGHRILKVTDIMRERDWLETGADYCSPSGGLVGIEFDEIEGHMKELLKQFKQADAPQGDVAASTAGATALAAPESPQP